MSWKEAQKDGEFPLLIVGLADGQLCEVKVLRVSMNLHPELKLTKLEHYAQG